MDHVLEALAGSLAGLNAWQALAKISAAIQALASAHLEAEHCSAESPVVMSHRTLAPALISQARSAAVGTRYRSGIPGRYRHDQEPFRPVQNPFKSICSFGRPVPTRVRQPQL